MSPIIEKHFFKQHPDTFWMTKNRAKHQDIRPLKIAILNLMPNKLETEEQLFRVLSNTPLQLEIDLIRTESYQSKHTSPEVLKQRYRYFSELKDEKFDAFIITGSPIEKMDFEDVAYWEELTGIFDYVRDNVYSTLFLCWSAQAALYYYYGINKHLIDEKIFALERFQTLHNGPLTRGFDETFVSPQSRYTFVKSSDILANPNLILYAGSEESGAQIVASQDHRFVFKAGHLEYDLDTLDKEYRRDVGKGLATALPKDYYVHDDPEAGIVGGWRASANLFYTNWLNYCVYQQTPYQLEEITTKEVSLPNGIAREESGSELNSSHRNGTQGNDYSYLQEAVDELNERLEKVKGLNSAQLNDIQEQIEEINNHLDNIGLLAEDEQYTQLPKTNEE